MIIEDGYRHDGKTGGFRAKMRINPDERYAIVSLSNSSEMRPDTTREGDFSKIKGFWSGTLDVGGKQLRLVMHVSQTGAANLYSIDQGGALIPSAKTSFDSNSGEFLATYPSINGLYKAKQVANGTLKGTWNQGGQIALEMEHSETMPDTLTAIVEGVYHGDLSPLVGFWSGYVGGEGGLFAYIEVSSIADRYQVKLWSPTQSPLPISVSKVSFDPESDDHDLLVESKEVDGVFRGTLDPERKEIVGVWSQGDHMQVTLSWSAERPE